MVLWFCKKLVVIIGNMKYCKINQLSNLDCFFRNYLLRNVWDDSVMYDNFLIEMLYRTKMQPGEIISIEYVFKMYDGTV